MRRPVVFASLMGLVLAAAAPGGSPVQAAFPGVNGRIALSAVAEDGLFALYTVSPDGTDLRRVIPPRIEPRQNDTEPVWAPDGSQLAFRRQVSPTSWRLFVVDADGTGVRQISTLPLIGAPTWSPDGRTLAFSAQVSGPTVQIFTVRSDGSQLTRITESPTHASYPVWSPNGARIAFYSNLEPMGQNFVFTMKPDGSDQRQLSDVASSGVAWSPDSATIAFGASVGGHVQIHLVPASGGPATPISDHPSDNFPRSFAPDGSRILFHSTRDSDYGGLHSMRVDGSDTAFVFGGSSHLGGDWQRRYFTDIAGLPYEGDIAWALVQGITAGCSPTRYCPGAAVTREQMASFLARALRLPPALTDHFDDDEQTAHEADINRIADAGITAGCGPRRFCPRDVVTREQMASFLARALELGPGADAFVDDDGTPHEADINRIAAAGISAGCAERRFCPRDPVTRGQMAAFLHRALS